MKPQKQLEFYKEQIDSIIMFAKSKGMVVTDDESLKSIMKMWIEHTRKVSVELEERKDEAIIVLKQMCGIKKMVNINQ